MFVVECVFVFLFVTCLHVLSQKIIQNKLILLAKNNLPNIHNAKLFRILQIAQHVFCWILRNLIYTGWLL
jgi:hypothetical protein